jgi:hypothetical protein
MKMSPQIDKLIQALCEAQKAMGGAKKDSVNPFHKSKYADLESVWEACKKPLNDNGIVIMQGGDTIDGKRYLNTIVAHVSGQFMEFPMMLPTIEGSKNEAQALGIAFTYCRRYSLSAAVGIVQTDDDGQGFDNLHKKETEQEVFRKGNQPATNNTPKPVQPVQSSKKPKEPTTPFDSPLETLKEYLSINGVDPSRLMEFLTEKAISKKTIPDKIIESALLNSDMTVKFTKVYQEYLTGANQLATA